MFYKEDEKGQILEEGINEAGSLAAWMACATSYSTNNYAMVPFYTFYSMFGFQRVMDLIWAAGDAQARGFLLGATAGRTTLNGEGLQHQDGHSHLLASVVPNCLSYDPAYAYELAVIVQHGLEQMYQHKQNCFYYITIMNENYVQPEMPIDCAQGIVRGMYKVEETRDSAMQRVTLLGAGSILGEVRQAAQILRDDYGVDADVWSLTSVNQLARDGHDCLRWNMLHPEEAPKTGYLAQQLAAAGSAPVIGATDYVKAYLDQLGPFVDARYITLGTDGYGRSDTRERLRSFFEVDRYFVTVAALKALADDGLLEQAVVSKALKSFGIKPDRADPLHS
jgi:pyruvate dehydrogenase E1 component